MDEEKIDEQVLSVKVINQPEPPKEKEEDDDDGYLEIVLTKEDMEVEDAENSSSKKE